MLRFVILIFLSSWCSLLTYGQNIDSILKSNTQDSNKVLALSTYAFKAADRNPDSALLLARKAVALAGTSKVKTSDAPALNALGWAHFRAGKYDSSRWYLGKAISAFEAVHNARDEARSLMNLSNVNQMTQDFQTALNNLIAAIQLLGPSEGAEYALAEKMIGITYRKQGNLQKAKLYLTKASSDFLQLKEQSYFADAISSLGNIYFDEGNMDSAGYYYHIALNIHLEQKNLTGAAIVYEDLGATFLYKSDYVLEPWLDSSLYYYQHAYDIFSVLKSSQDLAYEKINLSQVLIKKKDYPLAKKYLTEALSTFEPQHATNTIYNILILLSSLYHEMQDYQNAYDYLLQAKAYNDTLNKQERGSIMADVLAKYETDKKDRTIALLNTQNKLLKTTELFVLLLIALSVFLALVLMNRYRIKQKLDEMQMRNRISNDLHDDVGSSLSSILLLSNIASGATTYNPELVGKISENAREAIERISDIIWTTNPKYDDGENLRPKIINYIVPLCQMKGIVPQINISESIKNIKLSMEMRKNIFLIIKEALNNILKHSGATEVTFHLFLKEKKLIFEISDNGTGFDGNDTYSGNGLKTMRSRAEVLGGDLLLTTQQNGGTKISVGIPLSRASYLMMTK